MAGESEMTISDVLDGLGRASEGERTSVGDILDAFGRRAYGPVIFVIGLISLSPVGSIPGASITAATILILFCGQMIFRKGTPWVPQFLRRIGVSSRRMRKAIDRSAAPLERAENYVKPRMKRFVNGAAYYLNALVILGLAALMYPLALVPWGVAPPALAITLLGLAQFTQDGLISAVGLAVSTAALAVSVYLLM